MPGSKPGMAPATHPTSDNPATQTRNQAATQAAAVEPSLNSPASTGSKETAETSSYSTRNSQTGSSAFEPTAETGIPWQTVRELRTRRTRAEPTRHPPHQATSLRCLNSGRTMRTSGPTGKAPDDLIRHHQVTVTARPASGGLSTASGRTSPRTSAHGPVPWSTQAQK